MATVLTDADKAEIVLLHQEGKTLNQLKRQFHIGHGKLTTILREAGCEILTSEDTVPHVSEEVIQQRAKEVRERHLREKQQKCLYPGKQLGIKVVPSAYLSR